MADAMLAAALRYARHGWPVFPIVPGAKVPLTTHGFHEATTDPATIARWWRRWPAANVAVATGAPAMDVLDVDTKDGRAGAELMERAARAGLLGGASARVRTPSGGTHLYYRGTDQPGGAVGPARALELKAVGGYVLVPPSIVGGRRYTVAERRASAAVLDFAAVRRLLDPPRAPKVYHGKRSGDFSGLTRWLESRPAGDHNAALYWAVCRAVETGADDRVLAELTAAIVAAGHDPREAERTVASARRRAVTA